MVAAFAIGLDFVLAQQFGHRVSSKLLILCCQPAAAIGSKVIRPPGAVKKCWQHGGIAAPQALSRELDQELANAAAHVCELWRSVGRNRMTGLPG
jgi:hypothetical protein